MNILGISAFYHDSAAALLQNGMIVAAAQEERFTRKKHDASFPKQAIQFCLDRGSIGLSDVDFVVFYDKPLLKFDRLLETYVAFAPRGLQSFVMSMPIWIKEKLFQKKLLKKELSQLGDQHDFENKILFTEHHQSHAASAFFPSPFEEAVVLTMDGVGEWATTSLAIGKGNKLTILREMHFPHSLGLLYSAFTYYTGFKVNSGEYKLMGLAPYGQPIYANVILDHMLDLKEDGTFRLNMRFFNYCSGLTMTSKQFDLLLGGPPRISTEPLTQRHMDIAASIQAVTEQIVLRLTRSIAEETKIKNLCLAGGVALNCVANGKILKDGQFEKIWIQPAAGDAGGALGAALCTHYDYLESMRIVSKKDAMQGAYLGISFEQADIEKRLQAVGAIFQTLQDEALFQLTAEILTEGNAVGWFQGRMEFGPRALGARSILGDPRSTTMQKNLNLKVKYRESFRPFAPSILEEDASDWFDLDVESPYMLLVASILDKHKRAMTDDEECLFGIDKLNVQRSLVPAITHIDYSARVQTVNRETNPRYHALLTEFKTLTGCPMLVNTSFNVRGEPIVCTPEDAFRCFMGTEIEYLVIGNCILHKEQQDPALRLDYKHAFELD